MVVGVWVFVRKVFERPSLTPVPFSRPVSVSSSGASASLCVLSCLCSCFNNCLFLLFYLFVSWFVMSSLVMLCLL